MKNILIGIAAFGLATGLFQGRIEADKNFARICYAIGASYMWVCKKCGKITLFPKDI